MQELPRDIVSWKRSYGVYEKEDLENEGFASGSNFKYISALRLRVLHNASRKVTIKKHKARSRTNWIRDNNLFSPERRKEAQTAVSGGHFRELLDAIDSVVELEPNKKWSTGAFMKAGNFGPFLSLLQLIHKGPKDNSTEVPTSAVTYYDNTPIAPRINRSQQRQQDQLETPSKKKGNDEIGKVTDLLIGLGIDHTPDTLNSSEEPPSTRSTQSEWEPRNIVVQDEQTVNQCLINLMLPITWCRDISGNIDPHRRAFLFMMDKLKGYEARVDGIVRDPNDPAIILGIIEVEKSARTAAVRLQEAAEMVAFMQMVALTRGEEEEKYSQTCVKRWLVSMCASKVYITIGTCKQPYLDFLERGGSLNQNPGDLKEHDFLRLEEYGGYELTERHHMIALLEHLFVLLSQSI